MEEESVVVGDDAPCPRLCHLVKWADFEGYGFNLHAEKNAGQYIGKVDQGSPAEAAGLKQGDRIVEVNGVNISNENHKQVVQRIRQMENEARLLVLDPEADLYYKERDIVVTGSMGSIKHCSAKRENFVPESEETKEKEEQEIPVEQVRILKETSDDYDSDKMPRPVSSDSVHSSEELTTPNLSAELNLNMSAKEMREMVAQRKKKDPRKDPQDFRKRYEIVQAM